LLLTMTKPCGLLLIVHPYGALEGFAAFRIFGKAH
jgi:hypothetical protein